MINASMIIHTYIEMFNAQRPCQQLLQSSIQFEQTKQKGATKKVIFDLNQNRIDSKENRFNTFVLLHFTFTSICRIRYIQYSVMKKEMFP